jgi:phosphoesterase RecJ-like protein
MTINELLNILPSGEHVYITGHVHPDGDCLGACLGLYQVLKNNQIDVTVILEERPEVYNYLSGFSAIKNYIDFQQKSAEILASSYTLIVMDSGDLTRIEPIQNLFDHATRTINIDHHESNNRFAMFNYVDTKASSSCEMVGLLIGLKEGDKRHLTFELAECLYTGLIYDTGVFKHSNTRYETHIIAAHLVDMGINHTWITNHCFFTRNLKAVKATSIALNKLEMYLDNKIATTLISAVDLEEHHLVKDDTEAIVNILNEIKDTYASVFFLELEPNNYKVSLRSNSLINVCSVAQKFGGGGHIKASGCSVKGSKAEVIENVLKELELEYRRNY